MDKNSIKELMYGGINELTRNRKYYYRSSLGFSHWTDEGKAALIDYTNLLVCMMCKAEDEELVQKAKEMVISGLKGEQV